MWTICGRLTRRCGSVIWKPGRSWRKQICLYLPTFRAGGGSGDGRADGRLSTVENAVLLIKPHPMSKITLPEDVSVGKGWSTYEMMKVAGLRDHRLLRRLLEVSLLNKPVYLYLYDYDAYTDAQGLNIDLWKAFPHAAFGRRRRWLRQCRGRTTIGRHCKSIGRRISRPLRRTIPETLSGSCSSASGTPAEAARTCGDISHVFETAHQNFAV